MRRHQDAFCKEVTKKFLEHPLARPFIRPVNPELDECYDYHQVIEHPMDIGNIKKKLDEGEYTDVIDWKSDFQLVWDNAKRYNKKNHVLHLLACKLNDKFRKATEFVPNDESELWSFKVKKSIKKIKEMLEKSVKNVNEDNITAKYDALREKENATTQKQEANEGKQKESS